MKINFRIITALLPKHGVHYLGNKYFATHLRAFLFLFFVILAGILLQILVFLNGKIVTVEALYELKNKEYHYWSSIVSQYPNVPDILYNASFSALSAGRKAEALKYIDKALRIDPVFEKASKLRDEILSL